MNPKEIYYETTANTIIENLKKRRMEGYYCKTVKEAVETACSFLTPNSTVTFGGSQTLEETGLLPLLREKKDIYLLDRAAASGPAEVQEIYAKAFTADTYFMSTNAITEDGQLVNLDGKGNRVAALCYGPDQVLVIAGMNKLVRTLDDAISRTRNTAAPINAQRFTGDTPCRQLGTCGDCRKPDCICNQLVITRGSMIPGRVKVILVGESLGF